MEQPLVCLVCITVCVTFSPGKAWDTPTYCFRRSWSWPISRVLSWTVIHLGQQSLTGSSSLPGFSTGRTMWTPIWPCSGWSLPCHGLLPAARCALTAPFHPYLIPLARAIGGLLSVALSVGSRLPGITWHFALWSPDFPPLHLSPPKRTAMKRRLSGQLRRG